MLHRLVVPGVQAYLGLQAQQAGLVSCLRHFAVRCFAAAQPSVTCPSFCGCGTQYATLPFNPQASPAIALDDQASPSQPSTSKGIVTVTVACVLERLPVGVLYVLGVLSIFEYSSLIRGPRVALQVVERRLPDHVLQAKSDLRRNEMARGNLKDFATISQVRARALMWLSTSMRTCMLPCRLQCQ